jgi:KDO2-lipid IV(A) lauroyltransferase
MMDSRSRFGSVLIDSKKALLYLKRNLKDVNVLAVVADQSPNKKNRKSWRKLLNQDTAFFKSVEYLPRIMNSYVYFASMQRTKRGHYSVNFDLISEPNSNSKKDILSEYVLKLENQIKSKPDEWLWTHNRWKFTQDDI